MQFFEDIRLDETVELGTHRFTRDEIIDFASRFDPQRFHLDEAAAAQSLFGGLCASGWHTACVWMQLMAAYRARVIAEMTAAGEPVARHGPSPGIRELKWIKPVYVDDEITYRWTPLERADVAKRPELGMLVSLNEGLNQKGELVFSFIGQFFVERRAASPVRGEP